MLALFARSSVLVLVLVLLGAARLPAQAKTLNVPAQYQTIQAAMQAAKTGDTVLVAPGTYTENVNFLGKAVCLRSTSGAKVTTVDGRKGGSAVTIGGPVGQAILEGFTITFGTGTPSGSSGHGGGVYVTGGAPIIRHNVITRNGCSTQPFGGKALGVGIYAPTGSALITGNTIASNGGGGGWGGGVYCGGSVKLTRNLITSNSNGDGGGVACFDTATVSENTIVENRASGGKFHPTGTGGGVYCSGTPTVIRNRIIGNQATPLGYSDAGGGVYVRSGTPRIEDNLIAANEAAKGGGVGGWNFSGGALLIGNRILRNRTYGSRPQGGGVWVYNALMVNNVIALNQSGDAAGGVFCQVLTGAFLNNTVIGNTAVKRGGGLVHEGPTGIAITNSVFWGNAAPTAPEIQAVSAAPTVTYCDVKGGWSGTGNRNVDPGLADAAGGDGHLKPGSPLIGAGNPAVTGLPPTDFEGDPRWTGKKIDIGADAYRPRLYQHDVARPGTSARVRVVAPPGWPVWIAVSAHPELAGPPTPIPGYGVFHLLPPFFALALGGTGTNGLLRWDIALPASFPSPSRFPMQALLFDPVGSTFTLSNAVVIRVP